MIHIGTSARPPSREGGATAPAQIAHGVGDGYLIALNAAIAEWGKGIYVRPMAEMNNDRQRCTARIARTASLKPGHLPPDYRKAFARISLILHGGSAASINAKLQALGLPGISADLAENPFPRLRIIWCPLAGGTPKIPANAPEAYYPGKAYVDVEAGDIFDEALTDTAPWRYLEALYAAAVKRNKPFAVPEWGLVLDRRSRLRQAHVRLSEGAARDRGSGLLREQARVDLRSRVEAEEPGDVSQLHHAARRTDPSVGCRSASQSPGTGRCDHTLAAGPATPSAVADSENGAGPGRGPLETALLAGLGWASLTAEAADDLADDVARLGGLDRDEIRLAVRDLRKLAPGGSARRTAPRRGDRPPDRAAAARSA